MHHELRPGEAELGFLARIAQATSRRQFLQWSGLTVGVMAIGCGDDGGVGPGETVNLGTGDTSILNYAYALEQLEAAFYVQVASSFYANATEAEQEILNDIRDHEVAHRDFFEDVLGDSAIPELEFNFSTVDFDSRESVLTTAMTFEDLGVSAYNGAGALIEDPTNLLVAGKIVSVEARHAAAIRSLRQPGTGFFAGDDVVNSSGLDVVRTPTQVLAAADPFIEATLTFSQQ